ncbi:Uncharacterized protein (competence- and mitomycin-induced) [Yokenella regensburgei]|nr:Uncharacterized protein (competence- and mitomycin-induced) [Yokenella regensburgei]
MSDPELMQLSELVGQALLARGATMTTAESCTGGWIAKAITDVAAVRRGLNAVLSPTVTKRKSR